MPMGFLLPFCLDDALITMVLATKKVSKLADKTKLISRESSEFNELLIFSLLKPLVIIKTTISVRTMKC